MVIIVSYEGDVHAQVVAEKIRTSGERVVILDYNLYPRNWECGVFPLNGKAYFKTPETTFEGSEVRSVWFRRVGSPAQKYKLFNNPLLSDYLKNESKAFLESLPEMLPILWVSRPDSIKRAAIKPLQLTVAKQLGFRVPQSVIGNSMAAANEFLAITTASEVVIKVIDKTYVRLDEQDLDRNVVAYAKVVGREQLLAQMESLPNGPLILQERVKKDCDIRVTVVGRRVFAARIDSGTDPKSVDWRHYSLPRQYSAHHLPSEIKNGCINLVDRLGLKFGCIDLALEGDKYTFFEINPAGQWLATEHQTGADISGTLVKLLLEGEN